VVGLHPGVRVHQPAGLGRHPVSRQLGSQTRRRNQTQTTSLYRLCLWDTSVRAGGVVVPVDIPDERVAVHVVVVVVVVAVVQHRDPVVVGRHLSYLALRVPVVQLFFLPYLALRVSRVSESYV